MMVRKVLCALALLALTLGVATAEQLKGKITKLEAGKVTFQVFNKADKSFGDAKTYDVAADCKVSKMAGKDNKEPVAAGLKAEPLANINAEKGVRATLDVNDGKVTEIILGGGGKKKD